MKKIIVFLLMIFIFPISIVEANEYVYLGGDSIGIEGEYEGVYVSGTYRFSIEDKTIDPSTEIMVSDLIIAIDDKTVNSLEDFINILKQYKDVYNDVEITLIREGKSHKSHLIFKNEKDKITCGLYLKEKVLGIGTMTFYTPENHIYGALGHPITNDINAYIQKGNIYAANIENIEKAKTNKIGDKLGNIDYSKPIGNIKANTEVGIYGIYKADINQKDEIEIASIDEIKLGKASFLTVINNQKIESFDIEITDINKNLLDTNKAISFTVIDENLLKTTGGIIHGMSGSPIIQNGKLVGAVTNVLVNDPTKGYGIFIENMLEEAEQ